MNTTKGLRFAPIIRVSTERQEQQGESLQTQKEQIIQAVNGLEGTIPEYCWKYSGQEHATPGHERKKYDMLLEDASKNMFDAVICRDHSRWSRDNKKSIDGLEILRKFGIRFFVGTQEQDLWNPEDYMLIAMFSSFNQYVADKQSKDSIDSRIKNAKEGKPSAGKLPWGRTYDKETKKWGIDLEKKQIIEQIANEYLEGGKGKEIAKKYGINYSPMMKVLRERCGDSWDISLKNKRLNIHETITMKVPRLLPEKTIQAIRKKIDANRTYMHGEIKHVYPLRGMIFCSECGFALSGQVNRWEKRYYRHPKSECKAFNSIPAEIVEDAVLFDLFSFFGDKAKMQKAAKDAIPNLKQLQEMKAKIANHQKMLHGIKKERSNLIGAMKKCGIEIEHEALRKVSTSLITGKIY